MTKRTSTLVAGSLALGAAFSLVVLAEESVLPPQFAQMDRDGDRAVTEEEYVAYFAARAREDFRTLDLDGDRVLRNPEVGLSTPVEPGQVGEPESGSSFLRRGFVRNDSQREALRKRVSAGPSMRQGGR